VTIKYFSTKDGRNAGLSFTQVNELNAPKPAGHSDYARGHGPLCSPFYSHTFAVNAVIGVTDTYYFTAKQN